MRVALYLKTYRRLLLQLLLVFAAFTIMVVMSSYFASSIVEKHISNYGDEVITASAETIRTYLQGHEITLNDMAFVIEGLQAQGSDAGAMQTELVLWSDWLYANDDRFESVLFLYGYIDGAFINSSNWTHPEDYDPETRVWYTGAGEHNGAIFYSDPYLDAYTGEFVMTISRQVFDTDGTPFGVVALDVFVSSISNYIGNLQLMNSGYAVLMDSNRRIIIHPVAGVLGVQIENVTGGSGYEEIASLLTAGEDISAFNYSAIQGANDVAFFKKLFNGWYLELSLSSKVYYKDVDDMRVSLSVTGVVLALLVGGVLTVMHIARKRAEEANRTKTSFLAKMSHEIRTPMNAVIGMTELLLREPLSERQSDYVNDINASAHSLLSIINDIPDISGSESGARQLGSEANDLTLCAPSAKILLVDDNDFNLKVACGLLMLFGINANTATSGRKAITMVSTNDYDLIFMDHMMPEMDGLETTGEIRKLGGKFKELPIIALTANAVHGARDMFLANGFSGYLSKPIDIHELSSVLIQWLPSNKVIQAAGACNKCAAGGKTAGGSVLKAGAATDTADHPASTAFSVGENSAGAGIDELLGIVEKIGDINIEIGLSRVAGMESMYIDNLRSFHDKLTQERGHMSASLEGGDIDGFSISVHAMKSSLATIGAMDLSETARKLEMASKEKNVVFCTEQFPEFDVKLLRLHQNMSALSKDRFSQSHSSAGVIASNKKPGDAAFLREQVQKALAALEDYDNDAGMEAINSLLVWDFGKQDNTLLQSASEALQAYDYETAGEILLKL